MNENHWHIKQNRIQNIMAEASECSASTSTVCINVDSQPSADNPTVVHIILKKPRSKKRVVWTSDTVDNEHMNKKKSKCCCIYEKPHNFGESSSDTDDECEHCRGHVEKKKPPAPQPPEPDGTS